MEDTAIFAGGCFWCMVKPFDTMPGIKQVISGYTGGHVANPTYEQVASHTTGHTEAVKIIFDPEVISYKQLVEIYWHQTIQRMPWVNSKTAGTTIDRLFLSRMMNNERSLRLPNRP